jgi:hypothetical protein
MQAWCIAVTHDRDDVSLYTGDMVPIQSITLLDSHAQMLFPGVLTVNEMTDDMAFQ